ncbi:hypothetical protein J1614_010652 [Plenodomus biglobosus]|nr:hypothetical protein J1614_010652 [Plenodomus biglobosus]
MNELVARVNDKIKEVIKTKHADRIVFIDVDSYVLALQGRFCEPGILEPSPSRPGILFYNFGTSDEEESGEDQWHHTELKRAPEEVPKGSFEASIALSFEETLTEHPDWKLSAPFTTASTTQLNISSTDSIKATGIEGTISSFLPDTMKRIFHPRPFLHEIMAELVLSRLVRDRAEAVGQEVLPSLLGPVAPLGSTCSLKALQYRRPRDLVCRESEWRAPREQTSDGSTSALDAIQQFCKNRDGAAVGNGQSEHVYDRWDVSGWGVTKRQSMWIRASRGPFPQCEQGSYALKKDDCVAVLVGGLTSCDKGSDFTSGFKAQGENCLEYGIDLSPSVHEGDPPWSEHVKKYPPPETLQSTVVEASGKHQIDCFIGRGHSWTWDDANAAINIACNDRKSGWKDKKYSVEKGSLQLAATIEFENPQGSAYAEQAWCR